MEEAFVWFQGLRGCGAVAVFSLGLEVFGSLSMVGFLERLEICLDWRCKEEYVP